MRVITQTGEQLGILSNYEAMQKAEEAGLDLVEVVPNASPPVCKIIDYGKFRYDQTKREKESKKSQHQVKVKELKLSPNISEHDLEVKLRQAKEFLEKGNKVKFSCFLRGREMAHQDIGRKLFARVEQELEELAVIESDPRMLGRMLHLILAPQTKKKK